MDLEKLCEKWQLNLEYFFETPAHQDSSVI